MCIAITPTLDTKRLIRCSVAYACFSAPSVRGETNFCRLAPATAADTARFSDGCRGNDNKSYVNDNDANINSRLVHKQTK